MKFWYKFVSSQPKLVNDFIGFKLIIKLWSSLFLVKVDVYLLQIEQFDKSISLFCLAFLTN